MSTPHFFLEGRKGGVAVVQFGFQRVQPGPLTKSFLVFAGHPGNLGDDSGGRFVIDEIRLFGPQANVAARLQTVSPDPMVLEFEQRRPYVRPVGGGIPPVHEGDFHSFSLEFSLEHPLLDEGQSAPRVRLETDLPVSGGVIGGNQFPFSLLLRWAQGIGGSADFFRWDWREQNNPDDINSFTGTLVAGQPFRFTLGNILHLDFDSNHGWFSLRGDYAGTPAPAIFAKFFPFDWAHWGRKILSERITTPADPGKFPVWSIRFTTGLSDALRVWNEAIAQPIVDALDRVAAADKVSFVPIFAANHAFDALNYALDFTAERQAGNQTQLTWKGLETPEIVQVATARFPGFQGEQQGGFRELRGSLLFKHDRIDPDEAFLAFLPKNFAVAEPGAGLARAFVVRDGSLQLELGGKFATAFEPTEQLIAAAILNVADSRPLTVWRAEAPPPTLPVLRLKGLSFPVLVARPASQDAVSGESSRPLFSRDSPDNLRKRRAPVAISLLAGTSAARSEDPLEAKVALRVTETTGLLESHRYSLALQAFALNDSVTNAGQTLQFGAVLMIDTEPFQVGLVWPEASAEGDSAESSQVIASRESGGAWVFSGFDRRFTLALPPSVLGEAMEKVAGGTDVQEGHLVDFRLGAPAVIRLRSTDLRKRFIEAPWNLRRIIGENPERLAAGVEQLDFELLYGLTCRVVFRPLRLADIFARVGLPPAILEDLQFEHTAEQGQAFADYLNEQIERAAQFRQRVGAYELFDEGKDGPLFLDAANDAVGWRPRVKRSADPDARLGARLRFPLLTADPLGRDEELQRLKNEAHDQQDGLAGGFPWGFESASIYKEFWRTPRSTSGELREVFLSALGGWGRQTARFSRDKTIIQSHTSVGRTHYYTLERIGRIAVFWHKAKHVIVFERTTAPTRQFRDEQDAHLGRAILRKVREYVEILEPERKSRDNVAADSPAAAFVEKCIFHDRIIPVSNGWSRDVEIQTAQGKITGWEIPLWQPGADPEIYPLPHVALHLAADEATTADKLPPPIRNPHILYFFTDTRDEVGADTDAWDCIPGIDYPESPDPAPSDDTSLTGEALQTELPEPGPIHPGFERFTFQVDVSSQQVNLNHRRVTAHSVNAVVKNVTMMRGTAGAATRPADLQMAGVFDLRKRLLDANQKAANGFSRVDTLLRKGAALDVTTLTTALRQHVEEWLPIAIDPAVAAQFRNFIGPDPDYDEGFCTLTAAQKCGGRLHILAWNTAAKHAEEFHGRTVALIDNAAAAFQKRVAALATGGEQWLADLTEEVDSLVAQLQARWERFETGAQTAMEVPVAEVDRVFHTLRDEVSDLLDAALALPRLLEQEGAIAEGRLEAARRAIAAADARAQEIFASARRAITEIAAALNTPSGEALTEVARLETAWQNLVQLLTAWASDAVNALARLHRVRQQGEQLAASLLSLIAEVQANIRAIADAALRGMRNTFADIAQNFSAIFTGFATRLRTLNQVAGTTIAERLAALDRNVKVLRAALAGDLKAALCDTLRNAILPRLQPLCGVGFLPASLHELMQNAATFSERLLQGLPGFQRIQALAGDVNAHRDALVAEVRRLGQSASEELRRIGEPLLAKAGDVLRTVEAGAALGQQASRTLRAARAFGEALTAPGLGFNRKSLAYMLREGGRPIEMTPCVARLKELGENLEALGLRLPTREFAERLLPTALQNFDLSSIISDIGALRLTNLLPSLRLPEGARDLIHVTHGIDRETRRPWAEANLNVPIGGRHALFSLGPIEVSLQDPRFEAQIKLSASLDGVQKTATGALTGSWQLSVAGGEIITFVNTRLRFENGQMHFELRPEQVRLPSLLRIISDLLPSSGSDGEEGEDDEGFHIGLIKVAGIPAGMRATLLLPDLAAGGGTTSVTGMQLGAFFELRFLRETGGGLPSFEFQLSTGFNLGRPERPFNIAIFILGGGGWVVATVSYFPLKRELTASVTIGLQVSATLEFALGPIQGGVGIYLGIFFVYQRSTGSEGGSLAIGISFLMEGHVCVLGLVEVSLSVLLQGSYDTGSKAITGRGTVRVKVKICWCFSITVEAGVSYTFGGGGNGGGGGGGGASALPANVPQSYLDRAADQVDLLE